MRVWVFGSKQKRDQFLQRREENGKAPADIEFSNGEILAFGQSGDEGEIFISAAVRMNDWSVREVWVERLIVPEPR